MAPSRIKAPTGTTEASVGGHVYPTDLDGVITLPEEDANAILATDAGFTVAVEPVEPTQEHAPVINALMTAPLGASSVSFAGLDYHVDTDGTIAVPVEAVHDLEGHGYVAIEPAVTIVADPDAPAHP